MTRIHPSTTRAGRRVRNAWLAALMAAALMATQAARADDESERANLAQIAHELARVQTMVAQAAATAPTGERVKFRYDWLQGDLQMLREGIARHVDAPRQPRPVPALRGDYRQ